MQTGQWLEPSPIWCIWRPSLPSASDAKKIYENIVQVIKINWKLISPQIGLQRNGAILELHQNLHWQNFNKPIGRVICTKSKSTTQSKPSSRHNCQVLFKYFPFFVSKKRKQIMILWDVIWRCRAILNLKIWIYCKSVQMRNLESVSPDLKI